MEEMVNLDEYLELVGKGPSPVQRLILTTLWKAGNSFPRDWVASSYMNNITGQKYFDRRIRELRDEHGCDIETGRNATGEHAYRLVSATVEVSNPRSYLTATQKKKLFVVARFCCSVCGAQILEGQKGLQADHKVPLSRGGGHHESNWQPLCVECNVGKRQACAGCEKECRRCPWAFPETVGQRTILSLSPASLGVLKAYSHSDGVTVDVVADRAIEAYDRLRRSS